MKLINRIFFTALMVTSFSIPMAYSADHHAEAKSYRQTQLTDTIFLLQGKGGNIALIKGEQGLILIDTDYKEMSAALKKVLQQHGGLDSVTYVINTHWHGDHTQGNELLGHHAQIIAHDNVRSRLLTQQEVKMFGMVSEAYPEYAVPSITYNKRLNIHLNDEHLEIAHFANGHTDGDSIVFMKKANIVHMGDHFFSGFYPFVDVNSGGSVVQMASNVETVLSMINDETVVIPGHGPLSDKSDLEDFHEMLIGTTGEVKAMMADGMTLEQMQEEGLSLDWEEWANGFLSTDLWIQIIVDSLNKHAK